LLFIYSAKITARNAATPVKPPATCMELAAPVDAVAEALAVPDGELPEVEEPVAEATAPDLTELAADFAAEAPEDRADEAAEAPEETALAAAEVADESTEVAEAVVESAAEVADTALVAAAVAPRVEEKKSLLIQLWTQFE
jgi:hypothetical protein